MANILQAVAWMREGKEVRRKSWEPGGWIALDLTNHPYPERMVDQFGYGYTIAGLHTISADDWEIVEE